MKKIIGAIAACCVLFSFMGLGVGTGFAAGGDTTRVIHVVFDNSGSMYMEKNQAWAQATYAMEVFASLLDFQAGDSMRVYTMHDVSTDGVSKKSQESVIEIGSKAVCQLE